MPHGRTSLLTGGLPYHRRSSMRVIDSLLIVRGESSRRFSLGIGIDVANPAAAAADLIAPCTVLGQSAHRLPAQVRVGYSMSTREA